MSHLNVVIEYYYAYTVIMFVWEFKKVERPDQADFYGHVV